MSEIIKRQVGDLTLIHVLRTGDPICHKCGKGPEEDGGSVVRRGSWDDGPLWWECEDCDEQWGFA